MDDETRRNLGLLAIGAILGIVFLVLSASSSEGVAETGRLLGGLGVLIGLIGLIGIARALFRSTD